MKPYTFANGDTYGGEEPPEPVTARSVGRKPPKPSNRLALRARRVKNDPNWATHSARVKQMLLDLDQKEGR